MRSSMWRGFLCNPAPDAVFHAKEAERATGALRLARAMTSPPNRTRGQRAVGVGVRELCSPAHGVDGLSGRRRRGS